jgi:predicted helicase
VNELLVNNNTGIQTKCDELSIQFEQSKLKEIVEDFKILEIENLKKKYPNKTDSSGWNFKDAVSDLRQNKIYFTKILYRPFDIRFTLYTGKSSGFIGRPRTTTMSHMVNGENLGLITLRLNGELNEYVCLITDHIIEKGSLPKGNYSLFPLYLYPESSGQQTIGQSAERTPNLNPEIVKEIAEKLGLTFTNEKETTKDTFAPIDLLDYIYAVLHSPTYREKYKEFLKIDFPRVPYPKAPSPSERAGGEVFWQLVKLGGEIRQIHLLESPTVEKYITQYPEDGNNVVGKIFFEKTSETLGRVYINYEKTLPSGAGRLQHFDNVPEVAWDFYIGGYQPAQKWLKDRKGRTLEFDDILHYQKIIVALSETDRLMKEINKIDIE